MRELHIAGDADQLAELAAGLFVELANQDLQGTGRFSVALSGGSTPEKTYQQLAKQEGIDWQNIHLFWGDERAVPPDHAESNYGMARTSLIEHIAIPSGNVHRIKGELDPAQAAKEYEKELRRHFGERAQYPRFDLIVLGLGEDGHTASLFPNTGALAETKRWVAANFVARLGEWRITLTLPAINHANNVVFLVTGESKAGISQRVLGGQLEQGVLPAEFVQPVEGKVIWLLDKDAAGNLDL